MRCIVVSVAAVSAAALFSVGTARAQTLDCGGASLEQVSFDDGSGEVALKVNAPSGAQDWMSVNFGGASAGRNLAGLITQLSVLGVSPGLAEIGVYPSNLALDVTGNTPDVTLPLSNLVNPTGIPGIPCNTSVGFDVPDITLPSGGIHAALKFPGGDTDTFVAHDTNGAIAGASYFSQDDYTTPASPLTNANTILRLGLVPTGIGPGSLTANGAAATTIDQNEDVTFTFWGSGSGIPWLLMLDLSGVGVGPYVGPFPSLVLFTDDDPIPGAGSVCGPIRCRAGAGTYTFVVFYKDGSTQISNPVDVTLNMDGECDSTFFGVRDDGIVDSNIFKVSNPAGPGDFFNVSFDTAADTVTSLTSVEVASWSFAAAPASWASVGIYPSNYCVDPSGGTPDVTNPISQVLGSSVPAGQSDWGFPATVYDTPDVPRADGVDYHAAVQWAPGDTALWVGADTDFVDGGNPVQGSSHFTSDSYATPAAPWTNANMLIRLNWN